MNEIRWATEFGASRIFWISVYVKESNTYDECERLASLYEFFFAFFSFWSPQNHDVFSRHAARALHLITFTKMNFRSKNISECRGTHSFLFRKLCLCGLNWEAEAIWVASAATFKMRSQISDSYCDQFFEGFTSFMKIPISFQTNVSPCHFLEAQRSSQM